MVTHPIDKIVLTCVDVRVISDDASQTRYRRPSKSYQSRPRSAQNTCAAINSSVLHSGGYECFAIFLNNYFALIVFGRFNAKCEKIDTH